MNEQTEGQVANKGLSKKVIAIVIIALLVIGGGVAAFFIGKSSDKNKYFAAEKATFDFMNDKVQERFALELDWLEYTEENPIESTVDISAEFNDPGLFGPGMMEIEDIINSSTVSITAQTDMEKKALAGELNANVAGMDFSDFRFGLTDEQFLLDLPFLKETLQLKSEDAGKLLHMADPYLFDEDAEIDFGSAFDSRQTLLTEEDKKHLEKEYGKMIYDELSEDAFSSTNETVTVEGEDIKTEKVELHLSEDEFKHLLKRVVTKMQTDDYLKGMLAGLFEDNFIPEDEVAEVMAEFDEALIIMEDQIETIELSEGITSTVWIDNNLIVQRELDIANVNEQDEKVAFNVIGTQLLEDNDQIFDYDFSVEDEFMDQSVNISGNLSRDGDDINDSIIMSVPDEFELAYEAEETLTDSERDFTRSISFDDMNDQGSLVWSGHAVYEKDQMSGENEIYVEAPGIDGDLFTLFIDTDNKKIKDVDMISEDNLLDIGSMSEAEINEYVENEAAEQFMEWYFEIFGLGGF